MDSLSEKKCRPCTGTTPKLNGEQINRYLPQLKGWQKNGDKIVKNLKFKNFVQLMEFVNRMAKLAEEEGHHPDFQVSYNKLKIEIWTHAVSGLTGNDFILAAKIDGIPQKSSH